MRSRGTGTRPDIARSATGCAVEPDDAASYLDVKRGAAAHATAAGEHVKDSNQRTQAAIREIYARMFAAHGLLSPRLTGSVPVRISTS